MMTKKRRLVLGAVAAALLAVAPRAGQGVCTGDPNGGGITGVDVSIILTCVNNPSNPVCATQCGGAGILNCADVNLDGVLNITDAVLVANEAAGAPCPLNPVPICSSPGTQLPCGSTISSDITSNTVLGGCEYFLDGTIYVQPGVVVTVRPGATIKGRTVSSDGTPSALIFLRGNCAALAGNNKPAAGQPFSARINAVGTATQPIVFTSDAPAGAKVTGQWAGIAWSGCSQVNNPSGTGDIEGLIGVSFGGGANNILDESSGVARYVRAEFAGRELAPNNELNVWTMNALGSCTDFSFIQAHMGADDGFEWFGGTNSMKYIVATANRDDNFDWQLGSAIKVQHGVIQQTNLNLDTAGSNGFEGDNNENGNSFLPWSNPKICNVTAIGDPSAPAGNNFGMLLRRGTAARVAKSIFHGFRSGGLRIDQVVTAQHACSAPPAPFNLSGQIPGFPLLVEASIFGDNGSFDCGNPGSTGAECNSSDFCNLITSTAAFPNGLDNSTRACSINPAISLSTAYGQINPVPSVPAHASNAFDCNVGFGGDPFFDSTNYLGGVPPNGPNWLNTPGGWISFATN